MAETNEKQAKKKPPFHEIAIAILLGEHDELMEAVGLLTWDVTSGLAYVISQSHIPEEIRPALTRNLIAEIRRYDYQGGDCHIHETFAMAVASMGTAELVEEAIEKERDEDFPPEKRMNDDELENLLKLLEAIGKLSRE
ncbi:MAG: hypothetical protein PHZ04_01315 [Patescibacteria group bacterium]|nr:hypothetical protein [Patescibacteria group bacterium]MDD5294472.1 hypothetical protein [Patescibacteria group bacterium]MDD5554383.1 hypothetical protein [Patescibacteria group bacterium]